MEYIVSGTILIVFGVLLLIWAIRHREEYTAKHRNPADLHRRRKQEVFENLGS
jgi:hypothetical protein